ncbi:unnamed protein product, partial [Amoebophrya sp. A120]
GDTSTLRLAKGQDFADGLQKGDSVAARSTFRTNGAISFLSATSHFVFVGTANGMLTIYRTKEDIFDQELQLSKPFRTEMFSAAGGIVSVFVNPAGFTCCAITTAGSAFAFSVHGGGTPMEIASAEKQITCGCYVEHETQGGGPKVSAIVLGAKGTNLFLYDVVASQLKPLSVENESGEEFVVGVAELPTSSSTNVTAGGSLSPILFCFFLTDNQDPSEPDQTSWQMAGQLLANESKLKLSGGTCNEIYVEGSEFLQPDGAKPSTCYFERIAGWDALLVGHSAANETQLFTFDEGKGQVVCLRPPEGRNLGSPDTDSFVKGFSVLASYQSVQSRGTAQEPME